MKKIFVCDFDGTINKFDIGNKITRSLLSPEQYNFIDKLYKERKITNFDIYEKYLAKLISKDGQGIKGIINKYLRETDGFREFANFVKNENYDLLILSDGFDIYISEFLKKYSLDIPYYANRLIKTEDGYNIIFPNRTEDCNKCGTCKSEVIKKLKENYGEIIYVGDGISDICPSEIVDVFFAKKSIFNKINTNKKFYFYDFNKLKELISKKGKYKSVIFDLDGTLVDGFDIIYESFNYSLRTLGLKEIPVREIKKVIGPALSEGFRRIVPENLVEEGVKLYRSYYKERYLERTILFEKVEEILNFLKDNKIIVGLITNKKQNFAKELLDYLKISKYFDFIKGADEGYLPKPDSEIMEDVKNSFKLSSEEIIYLGDSEIDGVFAKNCNVDFIALGVGLGNEKNLYKYRPMTYLKSINDLYEILKLIIL